MTETIQQEKTKCYHCGDLCSGEDIQLEGKMFCCHGCKTVFEILSENSLCDYYSLEVAPGNKVESKTVREYAFLDDAKIRSELLNFQEGSLCDITLHIPSIHCSSCIWLLENLHKIQPGVIQSSISFQKKELKVQFDNEKVSLANLAALLDSLGYAPQITLGGKPVTHKSVNKSLYYKIGISGFCFGNIMLLSISEYVSFFQDFTGEFQLFFSFVNLLLSIPVFFYCASDYFTSAWSAIKNRMINIDLPIALALTAAFFQSIFEIFSQTGMGYLDSLTGLIFFLLIGKWYQSKTYEALSFDRDYRSYFPLAATVLREGKETYVPLQDLNPGDTIFIRNQDVIPADSILRSGKARIDYSFVTGESEPVKKSPGERIFSGGRQVGERIQLEVVKKVSESYLTQLWNKHNDGKPSATGLTDFTNKVGKYFTVAILLVSALSYLYWRYADPSIAMHAAISVLIIFCPCTLALAIPFCFGNAMNILSRNGFYLKNAETIERLTNNDVIVFDKTGTITSPGEAEIDLEGFLTNEEKQYVYSLVRNSSHPLSRIIAGHLRETSILPVELFQEIPSRGISGTVNGRSVKIGSPLFTGLDNREVVNGKETRVFVNVDGKVKGCFTFGNKYRNGIGQVLEDLSSSYDLHLLSGDNDAERKYLSAYFPPENLFFNQSPSDKLEYIRKLEKAHKTIMVGDGLNDAGALLESNCGISISESSANFSPACDAILEAGKISKLPEFLSYARACVRTVRLSLVISLLYNFVGLFFACQGLFKPLTAAIIMPLSSVSIVLFVTLMCKVLAKKYGLKT